MHILEGARDGKTVAELMNEGREILLRDQVLPGVPEMLHGRSGRSHIPGRHQTGDCSQPHCLRIDT